MKDDVIIKLGLDVDIDGFVYEFLQDRVSKQEVLDGKLKNKEWLEHALNNFIERKITRFLQTENENIIWYSVHIAEETKHNIFTKMIETINFMSEEDLYGEAY